MSSRVRWTAARDDRFALFGECMLVGVLTVTAALPVVTLLPAFAAGCAHVRAHVDGDGPTGAADFYRRFRAAVAGSLPAGALWVFTLAVLAVDLAVATAAGLPGGEAVTVVCAVATVAIVVVGLRAAGAWRPGVAWATLLRSAARRSLWEGPAASALLAAAVVVAAVTSAILPPLAVPMTGCLVLAAVAVEGEPGQGPWEVATDA